jgi:hypothetical protein
VSERDTLHQAENFLSSLSSLSRYRLLACWYELQKFDIVTDPTHDFIRSWNSSGVFNELPKEERGERGE